SYVTQEIPFTIDGREANNLPQVTINATAPSASIIRDDHSETIPIEALIADDDFEDSPDPDRITEVTCTLGSHACTLAREGTTNIYKGTVAVDDATVDGREYTLTVTATDARHGLYPAGGTPTKGQIIAEKNITIRNNVASALSLTAPAATGATINLSGQITFSGTVRDAHDGVMEVTVSETSPSARVIGVQSYSTHPTDEVAFSISTTNENKPVRPGTHTYKIVAKDARGIPSEQIVNVEVLNQPPTIAMTAPSTSTIVLNEGANEDVIVSTTVTDPNGDSISQVTLQVDGAPTSPYTLDRVGTTSTYSKTIRFSTAGSKTLRLQATDQHSATSTRDEGITVRFNTAPTFEGIAPTLNAKIDKGTNLSVDVEFSVTARDDDDGVNGVFLYQIDASGAEANVASIVSSVSPPPATLELKKTFNLPVGDYTYKFIARDGNFMRSQAPLVQFKIVANGGWSTWVACSKQC
ncbi:MAG: hypothetical protein AAB855_04420, partial [Patescibacteria group bacterium]